MRNVVSRYLIGACLLLTQTGVLAGTRLLPPPKTEGGMPLFSALKLRHSDRALRSAPLSDETLSSLLWAAFGINRPDGRRTAPSAVNWQEIDIYVALPDGLYLYDAKEHALELLLDEDIRASAGQQRFIARTPAVLIYVADLSRMGRASPEQKDFYSAADTGYISQNVYLYCAAEGLATMVVAMIDKPALAEVMGLRPEQRVILCQPVGYPETRDEPASGDGAKAYKDGIYCGTAPGYGGDIEVEVRVKDGRIGGACVLKQYETQPLDAPAAICRRVVQKQGTEDVDAVTGATITSRAILKAIDNALDKARGGVGESALFRVLAGEGKAKLETGNSKLGCPEHRTRP